MQRCAQHAGREGRNIAKRTELDTAVRPCNELSEKPVAGSKRTRGRHSAKSRIAYVDRLQEWLRGIISRYRKSRRWEMKKFGTTPANAAPCRFTLVTCPLVHSTTDLGGQPIRQVIGQRNSRIQPKGDKGQKASAGCSAAPRRGSCASSTSGTSFARPFARRRPLTLRCVCSYYCAKRAWFTRFIDLLE